MFIPMMHRNVWEDPIDVLYLRPNIENQLCNAFKEGRGQELNTLIRLQTSAGDRFVRQIGSLRWIGPASLVIEGVVILVAGQGHSDWRVDGESASIELDLRPQQRNGELTVLNRFTI